MAKQTKAPRTAKQDMVRMIRMHGANGAILALASALKDLGKEWRGEAGPAVGIESVTGYSPHRADDWKGAARCEECNSCQEYFFTPDQAGPCLRRYASRAGYADRN